jgi:hypothetical protein
VGCCLPQASSQVMDPACVVEAAKKLNDLCGGGGPW